MFCLELGLTGEPEMEKGTTPERNRIAGYTITLPGKRLYLTPLLSQKKFRSYGNKDGAVKAFYQLEKEGLGKTSVIGNSRSNPVSATTGM